MAMNFPNFPTLNQEANGYKWDGQKWNFASGIITPPPETFVGPIGLALLMMGVRNG